MGSQRSATCSLLSDDDTESVRKSSPYGQSNDITQEGFTLIGQQGKSWLPVMNESSKERKEGLNIATAGAGEFQDL